MAQKLPQNTDIVNTAIEMAEDGYPVFPVGHNKRPPYSNKDLGLKRGEGGLKLASTDPEKVEKLFTDPRWAGRVTGIGMPTGKLSNCTVIDVDCGTGKEHRDSAVQWLESQRKGPLWGAAVVRTGSGGLHYYCAYTEGIKTGASVYADGIDIRNDGGYVVVPPFMGYKWERQTDRDDWPSAPPVPEQRQRGSISAPENSGVTPPQIIEMARLIRDRVTWHEPVRDIVAHLVGSGWSDAEVLKFCFQWSWSGYEPRETFETICVMIQGARDKWEKKNGKAPVDIEEIRAEKLLNAWDKCSPETRREFLDMVQK